MKKAGERHSKARKPVTLDLEASEVSRHPTAPADNAPDDDVSAPSADDPAQAASLSPDSPLPQSSSTEGPIEPGSEEKTAESVIEPETEAVDTAGDTAAHSASADADRVQPAPEPERTPPPPTKASGGKAGVFAAAVLGGVIALAGGYGLQTTGILPAPGQSGQAAELDALKAEFANLRAEVQAPVAPQPDPSVEARLSDLSAAVAALGDNGGGVTSPESLARMQADLDALSERLDALSQSAGDGTVDPALVSTLNELRTNADSLAQRVATAEASASGAAEAAQDASESLAEIGARIDAADAAQATIRETVEQAVAQQAALEAKVDERIAAVEARLAEPSANLDLARAVAATGLRAAIDRGGPFMAELEAFAAVAPDDPATAGLRDLAASGVPSRAELSASFNDAAHAIIDATRELPADAGVFDRLAASALSVVKVRKVGDAEGEGVDAITARIEARLSQGDLAAAFSEWQSLPENAHSAASAFGQALEARLRAEELVAASLKPRAGGEAGQ